MDDFPEPYEGPDYEVFERNQLDLDRDAEQAAESATDECPCCMADMQGSDHCPLCFCEAHESIDPQHLRDHIRILLARLWNIQRAMETTTRIECTNGNTWGR